MEGIIVAFWIFSRWLRQTELRSNQDSLLLLQQPEYCNALEVYNHLKASMVHHLYEVLKTYRKQQRVWRSIVASKQN